jgi:alkylation response protein AidB-like acyl-CoA dehydrogenase
MRFLPTDDEKIVHDSARRALEQSYTMSARKAVLCNGGFSKSNWTQFANLGWLGVNIPGDGETGSELRHACAILEAAGRSLVVEPLLDSLIGVPIVIRRSGPTDHHLAHLSELAAGRRITILVSDSDAIGAGLPTVTARATNDMLILDGSARFLPAAPHADSFLIRVAVQGPDPGDTLLLLDRDTAGVSVYPGQTITGATFGHLHLQNVQVAETSLIGKLGSGASPWNTAKTAMTLGCAAELLGTMERALEITVEYLKIRRQFGSVLSDFQVVRHRVADMYAEVELARSILRRGLLAWEDNSCDLDRIVSGLYAIAMRGALFVCEQAIQLHGGMGMTDECAVGHYYKHTLLRAAVFGSPVTHIQYLSDTSELLFPPCH